MHADSIEYQELEADEDFEPLSKFIERESIEDNNATSEAELDDQEIANEDVAVSEEEAAFDPSSDPVMPESSIADETEEPAYDQVQDEIGVADSLGGHTDTSYGLSAFGPSEAEYSPEEEATDFDEYETAGLEDAEQIEEAPEGGEEEASFEAPLSSDYESDELTFDDAVVGSIGIHDSSAKTEAPRKRKRLFRTLLSSLRAS